MSKQETTTPPTQPAGTGQPLKAPATPATSATVPVQNAQTPGQSGAQPVTLTQEQLEARLKETEETAFRRAQSYFDKTQGKVREQVQALEQAWAIQAAAGNPVDEATKSQIKNQLAQSALTENLLVQQAPPLNTTSTSGSAQQPAPGTYDPVLQIVLSMQQEAGVELLDNDPELAMLDQSNPYALVKSLPKALEAKRARTSLNNNNLTPETPPPPDVPGLTSGDPGNPREGKSGYRLISGHFENK